MSVCLCAMVQMLVIRRKVVRVCMCVRVWLCVRVGRRAVEVGIGRCVRPRGMMCGCVRVIIVIGMVGGEG